MMHPAPPLASNSFPSQTGGTLWPFGMGVPGSLGLEKERISHFSHSLPRMGKGQSLESHGIQVTQANWTHAKYLSFWLEGHWPESTPPQMSIA